jgi:enterochelin esterase-like enzyme
MGYSMGGYGALILPAKNPDVFGTGIPLSMSFRTDSQYMAEPQDVFDSQWGITFGGYGTSGEARLTDYFKAHSPFHFFDQNDLSEYTGLRLLLDCGDDEETLSVTNGALHNLMMERKIPHAYRVRNGGHSWDYWHQSLHEALNFVSHGFQGTVYPEDPEPVPVGDLISPDRYIIESIEGTDLQIGIFKPSAYDSDTVSYPVIFFIHDFEGSSRSESAIQLLSFLNNNMTASRIPNSIVVEIPAGQDEITTGVMSGIIDHINAHYRIVADKKGKVFLGNEKGAADVCLLIPDFREIFNACFLFDAQLEQDVEAESGMYYYLDLVDQSDNYQGNYDLYLDLREKGNNHEYRIRRGLPAIQSFINGLDGSMSYLSQKLKGQ